MKKKPFLAIIFILLAIGIFFFSKRTNFDPVFSPRDINNPSTEKIAELTNPQLPEEASKEKSEKVQDWLQHKCKTPTLEEVKFLLKEGNPSLLPGIAVMYLALPGEEQAEIYGTLFKSLVKSDLSLDENSLALASISNPTDFQLAKSSLLKAKPDDAGWRILLSSRMLHTSPDESWKLIEESSSLPVTSWAKSARIESITDALHKLGRTESGALVWALKATNQPFLSLFPFQDVDLNQNDAEKRAAAVYRVALSLSESEDSNLDLKGVSIQIEKHVLNSYSGAAEFLSVSREDALAQIQKDEAEILKLLPLEVNFEKIADAMEKRGSLEAWLNRIRVGGEKAGSDYLRQSAPDLYDKYSEFTDPEQKNAGIGDKVE